MFMKPGIKYIVKKESDDGTFHIGDSIELHLDGSILCSQAGGWLDAESFAEATQGMEIEINKEWLAREMDRLSKDLDYIKRITDNG